jgi:hypothetical protein
MDHVCQLASPMPPAIAVVISLIISPACGDDGGAENLIAARLDVKLDKACGLAVGARGRRGSTAA